MQKLKVVGKAVVHKQRKFMSPAEKEIPAPKNVCEEATGRTVLIEIRSH